MRQLVQLQKQVKEFEEAGLQIVGVSYDKVEVLKKFSDKHKLTFPLLSDPKSEVIKEYELHFQKGLPHPGTLLIDQTGVVRGKLFEEGYRKRHSIDDLLREAKKLPTPKPAAEAR